MKVNYIVVHCSDSPDNRDVSAKDIHAWHKQRGWDGIGYHAVIKRCGDVEMGRPLYWSGAHVKGHNHHSIGVCLIGRDDFEIKQEQALIDLLYMWKKKFPDAEIVGHRDLDNKKTCPNFDVRQFLEDNYFNQKKD